MIQTPLVAEIRSTFDLQQAKEKYTRRDSNPQPSVPKTDVLSN